MYVIYIFYYSTYIHYLLLSFPPRPSHSSCRRTGVEPQAPEGAELERKFRSRSNRGSYLFAGIWKEVGKKFIAELKLPLNGQISTSRESKNKFPKSHVCKSLRILMQQTAIFRNCLTLHRKQLPTTTLNSPLEGVTTYDNHRQNTPTKHCPRCRTHRDPTWFSSDYNRPDGRACWCKPCSRAAWRERVWGIGQEEFEQDSVAQQGGCANPQVPLDKSSHAPPTSIAWSRTPDGENCGLPCVPNVVPACEGSGGMWGGCGGRWNTWVDSSAHRQGQGFFVEVPFTRLCASSCGWM